MDSPGCFMHRAEIPHDRRQPCTPRVGVLTRLAHLRVGTLTRLASLNCFPPVSFLLVNPLKHALPEFLDGGIHIFGLAGLKHTAT